MSVASALANSVISRSKGADYKVDPEIDSRYVIAIMVKRAVMKFTGIIKFRKLQTSPFVGRSVKIRAKRCLKLGRGVTLDDGSYIDAMSSGGVSIGSNSSVGKNTRIECVGSLKHLGKGLTVGSNVGLGTDSLYGCAGGISVGDNTIVGNFCSFHSENHVSTSLSVPIRDQGVTHQGIAIGENCWIGSRVTVLDGANIGNGCIIAAGAVVAAGEYLPNAVYGGVPARFLKER
ncbi:acyltransferase [Rhodococcoides fascians]|uniref:acyltransferase n=1 Tax=Rhodococcoides fascians TaxID=1828 RepID=UPI001114E085|nr:DapH/DapD/GlmU-related protein [Rhodococcus fascians]